MDVSPLVSDNFFLNILVYVSFVSMQMAEDVVSTEQSLGQKLVIWGTDVNVASCKEKFQVGFVSSFFLNEKLV